MSGAHSGTTYRNHEATVANSIGQSICRPAAKIPAVCQDGANGANIVEGWWRCRSKRSKSHYPIPTLRKHTCKRRVDPNVHTIYSVSTSMQACGPVSGIIQVRLHLRLQRRLFVECSQADLGNVHTTEDELVRTWLTPTVIAVRRARTSEIQLFHDASIFILISAFVSTIGTS